MTVHTGPFSFSMSRSVRANNPICRTDSDQSSFRFSSPSIGIAKFRFCPWVYPPLATPTTLPRSLTTGPPEEPGEIAASI
jgi:hypothetical protein